MESVPTTTRGRGGARARVPYRHLRYEDLPKEFGEIANFAETCATEHAVKLKRASGAQETHREEEDLIYETALTVFNEKILALLNIAAAARSVNTTTPATTQAQMTFKDTLEVWPYKANEAKYEEMRKADAGRTDAQCKAEFIALCKAGALTPEAMVAAWMAIAATDERKKIGVFLLKQTESFILQFNFLQFQKLDQAKRLSWGPLINTLTVPLFPVDVDPALDRLNDGIILSHRDAVGGSDAQQLFTKKAPTAAGHIPVELLSDGSYGANTITIEGPFQELEQRLATLERRGPSHTYNNNGANYNNSGANYNNNGGGYSNYSRGGGGYRGTRGSYSRGRAGGGRGYGRNPHGGEADDAPQAQKQQQQQQQQPQKQMENPKVFH